MPAVTLKEKAYDAMRRAILDGELRPGDFLTERTLVERLGMSRTPIRAALERLDAEGLAKYTPNKGLIVSDISAAQVAEVFDFRIAIEGYVAKRLAGGTWREADRAWFRANLQEQERCVQANDAERFTAADAAFHRKLVELYDNGEMLRAADRLQDRLYRLALRVLRKDAQRIRASYEDHLRIFELAAAGRGDEAAQRMEAHLEYGKRILLS
ncbi:GntR family transcriptional regulator [Paenibacillus sp.]|uniref:GntR family transcriptional regulator n=1 Tax=Paenibacillus sp. TaxID=58172 RepID=UPI002D45D639|nr:GntR family transcriptional regulator [Paenibacillus sp.]HZG57698.1 GntR family transcriptional regulator [Paenibacillus sp.]